MVIKLPVNLARGPSHLWEELKLKFESRANMAQHRSMCSAKTKFVQICLMSIAAIACGIYVHYRKGSI